MKFIIFLCLLCLGISSVVITPQGICACSQLANAQDCSNMPGCAWQQQSCQLNACTNIQVQSDCLKASRYCQWNLDTSKCTTFGGCQNIKITSYKECGLSNIQCLAFNGFQCQQLETIGNPCSQYTKQFCTENVGIDGVCIWNDNSCQAITSCNQASINQCNLLNSANKYACQLVNGQCTQITNCNDFVSQSSCKYYFSSLQSPDMILCQWISNQCIEAQNTHYLNSTNCLIASGYNYRWLSTDNTGICATCNIQPIQVITKNQCECSQYILMSDCNTNYCQWSNSKCIDLTCTSITSQSICISIQNCFWDFQNTGSCSELSNCTELPLTGSSLICASQSAYCPAYDGQSCQNASYLNKCTSNSQGCVNWIGSNGICKMTNGLCQPIKSCYQILDAVYCSNHHCEWDASSQLCQPQTCSSYNSNPSKCLYIVSGGQYLFCKYNAESQLCENALFVSPQNCSIGTQYTHRWSNSSVDKGMCLSCSVNGMQLQTQSSCFCYQFTLQKDCNNSGYCQYNGTSCILKQCSILNQATCISMSMCYWDGQNGCSDFTGCNQLIANNQLECIGQNINCKGFMNGKCQASTSLTCSQIISCTDNIGSDGICYMNNGQCTGFNSCYGTTQKICEKYFAACHWNNSQNLCESQSCVNFTSQQSCVFFLMSPISTQIIPCVWNSTKNVCNIAQEIQTQLTSATCSANTRSTYRWVPIDSSHGQCLQCQQHISFKGQCPCNYLFTQNDCRQAYECYWNKNTCQTYMCSQILLQSVCASQMQCAWVSDQCVNYNGQCSSLQGSNQEQCLFQQILCNSSNGTTCHQEMDKCKSNKTLTGCQDIIGTNGICYWNRQHLICLPATECSQLPQYECLQQQSACYYANNQCQKLTCQQLYLNTGYCNYVISLVTQSRIQTCQMVDNQCINTTDLFQLNEEQCFSNSAHTSRWIPLKNNTGMCEQCLRSLIPINNIQKCQCYQFITKQDCLNNICAWEDGECSAMDCTQITTQVRCVQIYGCAWDNNACGVYQSCSNADGSNLSSCLAYSLVCRGYNGTTCTQEPVYQCSQFNSQTCNNNIGTDGICQYDQDICQSFNQCEQITNFKICSTYTNACNWINGQCMAITCQSITSQQNCLYVISSFLTGDIELCQWDLHKQVCENINQIRNKNSNDCATSTAFTYRWIPITNQQIEGYCSKCIVDFYSIIPGQCLCYQLYSQVECSQNPNCDWNGQKCTNIDCSKIDSQYYCSVNLRCAWNIYNQKCEQFTGCSDLNGSNSLECLSQSLNCQGLSGTYDFKMAQACSEVNTSQKLLKYNELIVDSTLCIITLTLSSCSQIPNFQMCSQCQYYCTWIIDSNNYASCQQTNCNNFTQNNCKYFFTSLGMPTTSTIQYCQWSNNQCVPYTLQSKIANQSQGTCYSTSLYMYRWSSQNSNGVCVSCSRQDQQYLPMMQYKFLYIYGYYYYYSCYCNDLPQYECNLASPVCSYSNEKCIVTTNCSSWGQEQCAQIKACIWLDATCQQFQNCSQITTATSPLECAAATINCQNFTGTCNQIEPCQNFNTSQKCQASNSNISLVSGLCSWQQIYEKYSCFIISSCSAIYDSQLCGLQTNRCYWNSLEKECKTMECSNFQNQGTCSFIYQNYLNNITVPCVWNGILCSQGVLPDDYSLCFYQYGFVSYNFSNFSCNACQLYYDYSFILSILWLQILY